MIRRMLGFFGVEPEAKKLLPLRLTRRFGFFVCLGILVFLCGSVCFFWQSSHAWFCGTCHVMDPYVKSWRESTHGKKGVECIQCHFPPGIENAIAHKVQAVSMVVAYITGTYDTRFVAEIQDASCMRPGCHDKRLLEGEVKFKGVRFDHKHHLGDLRRGKQLRCQTCHSQIVQGDHMTVTESVCFTCHFKDLKHGREENPFAGCIGCHTVPSKPIKLASGSDFEHKEFIVRKVPCFKCHFDSIQGDGRVPKQVCLGCHPEPERLAKYDQPVFLHENHVAKHHVKCFYCHSEIRHGKNPEPYPEDSLCNRCHVSKHDYTALMYRGTGAIGVADMPSNKSAAHVQCIACHEILAGAQGHPPKTTYEAGEKACVECHGPEIEGTLAEWKKSVAEGLTKATAKMQEAEAAAKALPTRDSQEAAAKILADARHNLDLVRYGNGVHNTGYADAVLEAVTAASDKVIQLGRAK